MSGKWNVCQANGMSGKCQANGMEFLSGKWNVEQKELSLEEQESY